MTGSLILSRRAGRAAHQALAGLAACLLAVTAIGCTAAEETTEPRPEATELPDSSETEATGICAHVDDLAGDLELAIADEISDPASAPERYATASERFSTIDPPTDLGREWGALSDLFAMASEALAGQDIQTEEDLSNALSLGNDEDTFFLVIMTPGAADAVGVHLQRECGSDLGYTEPAIDDPCATIDAGTLEAALGGAPDGERIAWAGGVRECVWTQGDSEAALVVGPADALRSDVLADVSELETVGGGIIMYDGAVGPFRAGGGRTAFMDVSDTGVLASAATGDDAADRDHAAQIVTEAAGQLG